MPAASSILPVPQVSIEEAQARLDGFKAARDAAWKVINPQARPSLQNDWASFAVASGEYLKFYRFTHGGQEPEPDQVELASSLYWNKYSGSASKTDAAPKTDEQRNKGNERKQATPQSAMKKAS